MCLCLFYEVTNHRELTGYVPGKNWVVLCTAIEFQDDCEEFTVDFAVIDKTIDITLA